MTDQEMDKDMRLYFYELVLRDIIESIESGDTFVEDYEPELSKLVDKLKKESLNGINSSLSEFSL